MDHAGLDPRRHLHRQPDVVGQQRSRKAILVVVAKPQRVLGVARLDDTGQRAEALLIEDLHLRRHVRQHGGLVIAAAVSAAAEQPGALGDGIGDVPVDDLPLLIVDERPDGDLRIVGAAHFLGLRQRGHFFAEFGVDRRFHDEAAGAHADLALVEESAEAAELHGLVHIEVLQNDHGVLAAHLQRGAL